MRKIPYLAGIVVAAAATALAGCATPCCNAIPSPLVATPAKIIATGYGSSDTYSRYTTGQQQILAMRAAQVDAYRNLAERVYGFRVTGNTAVSSAVVHSDAVRSYVDSFIRGARMVGVVGIANGNYEATVELDITPQFVACVQTQTNCGLSSPSVVSPCSPTGCSASSAIFVSN